jgi:TetR/AcrR family transcriptional repressor of nem operon
MTAKTPAKTDTKTILLDAGMDIMFEKGYTNTGISEVLNSVGVPKGSFYHYFDSKEDFALEIIRYFDSGYSERLIQTLRDCNCSSVQRLRNYCQSGRDNLAAANCCRGCLIGNLSQEMADQSEVLRQALSTVMSKWRDLFAACIEEGQQKGEIRTSCGAHALAELFLSGWEGAMMRAKTTKSLEPLDVFVDLMFELVLKV